MNSGNKGWVVSLWIDSSQDLINERKDLPYLSWSPYDRITIEEVTTFPYFFRKTKDLKWNGTVQRLHLIPIKECNWKVNEENLITIPDSKNYGIYCIITARYCKQFSDVKDIQGKLKEKLDLSLQGENIQWQGFYSLGSEDFVGIFLADDIATLSIPVDIIRQITYFETDSDEEDFVLFNSVYSFLGLNILDFEAEPKADLLVRLYLKAGKTRQEVNSQLAIEFQRIFGESADKIKTREIISGRSCLELEIPSHAKSLVCFHNVPNAIFNGQSEFYKEYIETSRTYWCISSKNDFYLSHLNIGKLKPLPGYGGDLHGHVLQEYDMHPISGFILKEYERMKNSTRCQLWKAILQQQYKAYKEFVKEYIKDGNENALCTLNNEVQTVLLHINQATTPIYEIPYHNYYYAGSYNDILKMYYGVIATIFNIGHKLPHDEGTCQYEVAYSVNFEAATKVHSSIYSMKNNPKRFVVFHLPYDAFMKFDKTIQLLLHEVFHYIAPYNRHNRNFIFLKIMIIYIWEQFISYLSKNGLSEDNRKDIVEYFFAQFDEICKTVDCETNPAFYELILNDFSEPANVLKFRKIPEKILVVLCNKVNRDLTTSIKEVREACQCDTVLSELMEPGSSFLFSFFETVRKISVAQKEAFCDLNMIYILGLSLNDYVKLLYGMFTDDYREEKVDIDLKEMVNQGKIKIGSYELRIGMVLNCYLGLPQNTKIEEYKDAFNVEMNKMMDDHKSVPEIFWKYLATSYEQYLIEYRTELSMHKEFFKEELSWFDSFKNGNYNKELRNAVFGQKQIKDYISVIHDFMNTELENYTPNLEKRESSKKRYATITAKKLEAPVEVTDLGGYVRECCNLIANWNNKNENKTIWFRGICNKEFLLTPSLFRNLKIGSSLYANQARFLKDAYYSTLSEPTLWTEQLVNVPQHMSFLQHYGIPTNLLDFSDNMLMALHFALNPDKEEDAKLVEDHSYQPKVVLFNPYLYYDAITSLKSGKPQHPSNGISPILLDMHPEEMKEYWVDDMSIDFLANHSCKHTTDYKPSIRTDLYPMPIAVRRSNARINAQSGTFVAYNLDADPVIVRNEDKVEYDYSYLSLDNIQEEYSKFMEKAGKPKKESIFIQEVYINSMAVSTIKNQLKTMNVTTARAYPEIFRIFQEYMKFKKSNS